MSNKSMTRNMDEIRAAVLERIERLSQAVVGLRQSAELVNASYEEVVGAWAGWKESIYGDKKRGCGAIAVFIDREINVIQDDIGAAVEQFAFLFVRDVIKAELDRATSPVVTLTSNAYMPPIRDYAEVDRLWCIDQADVFSLFIETFERKLSEMNIHVGSPDYDNMLYGVDDNKWNYIGDTDQDNDPNAWLDPANYDARRD